MSNTPELREALEALEAEVRELAATEEITEEQDARFAELTEEVPAARAAVAKSEARDALVESARKQANIPELRNDFQIARGVETNLDLRSASRTEVRDAAKKLIDEADHMTAEAQSSALRNASHSTTDRDGDTIARMIVASERDEYKSAFMKSMSGRESLMTDVERRAVEEFRAMSSTDGAGGYAVPTLIDPTVITTDGSGDLGILPYCRIETITNDAWKGVSAGHTAWSFDAEAAEVSDDTSTFTQPSVPAESARGFIPFSIEIGQDFPDFANQMGMLLREGYDDLLAENLATGAGSGSNAPWGVFTTTTTKVDVTTDNTFGADDLDKVWAALGEKFRSRATWFCSVDVENAIRAFASTQGSRFTVDQTREGITLLNGRPVVLSDYAPAWSGTDGANILAVGDFNRFLVAQRAGMTVEYVPNLFGTTNARPTGQRGWFAHARVGSDLITTNAMRVLKNQTT